MIRTVFAGAGALAVTACGTTTTTSFAPPPIAVQYTGDTNVDFTCPEGGLSKTKVIIPRSRLGTYQLIDTFISAVRCSAHASANGRQDFEVPAFISTTAAATAVALGGGATWGILGTTGNAAFNAGNKYWDPKAKAAIYDHALDALLCIKNEAVGVDAFKFDFKPPKTEKGANILSLNMLAALQSIPVPVEDQYFMLVSTAVFSVERVLAHRLSNVGTFDASSVAAELQKAMQAKKDLEDNPPEPNDDAAETAEAAANAEANPEKKAAKTFVAALARQQANAEVDLKKLKPKLDECVVLAKM
jgi:hypothetical protein